MADENGSRSWWQTFPGLLTALAGLVTAIAGLIAVLPKACSPAVATPTPTPPTLVPALVPTLVPTSAPPAHEAVKLDPRREAETLAIDYVTALLHGDLDSILSQSSMPFFLYNEVILSPADLRQRYEKLKRPPKPEEVKILKVETRTLGEWKNHGWDLSKDQLYKSIQLGDDEYMITVIVPGNGIAIYTRRVGDKMTVAGWSE